MIFLLWHVSIQCPPLKILFLRSVVVQRAWSQAQEEGNGGQCGSGRRLSRPFRGCKRVYDRVCDPNNMLHLSPVRRPFFPASLFSSQTPSLPKLMQHQLSHITTASTFGIMPLLVSQQRDHLGINISPGLPIHYYYDTTQTIEYILYLILAKRSALCPELIASCGSQALWRLSHESGARPNLAVVAGGDQTGLHWPTASPLTIPFCFR